jgi:hypothetical protein
MTPEERADLLRAVQELQAIKTDMHRRLREVGIVLEGLYNRLGAEHPVTSAQETG